MHRAALATLDWFIPNAAGIERSEIGLARNFIATHLFGPFLIQSIVVSTYLSDPEPGFACWVMMACVGTFWLLPFGFKMTRDLRFMALISVELLCVTSLVGTSFYGGVNSPFLPWLLVSLMLGFFYLSNHAIRVLALFSSNIVVMIAVHLIYQFPQHLTPADLSAISWFSMLSATAYMSLMAIYYAGIITMSSELERETAQHRLMAQRLRLAKHQAEVASHGKSVFLAKMKRQFDAPLSHLVVSSQALMHKLDRDPSRSARKAEIGRIHAIGRQLLELVHEAVDPNRMAEDRESAVQEVSLDRVLGELAVASLPLLGPYGAALVIEPGKDLGRARIDVRKLQHVCETLLVKAAAVARSPTLRLEATRHKRTTGDWIDFRIRTSSHFLDKSHGQSLSIISSPASTSDPVQIEAELEMTQLHCAVLGGSLRVTREPSGILRFSVEVPAQPVNSLV